MIDGNDLAQMFGDVEDQVKRQKHKAYKLEDWTNNGWATCFSFSLRQLRIININSHWLLEVVVITVGLSDLLHGLILCKHPLQTV